MASIVPTVQGQQLAKRAASQLNSCHKMLQTVKSLVKECSDMTAELAVAAASLQARVQQQKIPEARSVADIALNHETIGHDVEQTTWLVVGGVRCFERRVASLHQKIRTASTQAEDFSSSQQHLEETHRRLGNHVRRRNSTPPSNPVS
ncbi:hypothetical protein OAM67_01870 [bacterium]|nr:hypothetical protein [bacterium]